MILLNRHVFLNNLNESILTDSIKNFNKFPKFINYAKYIFNDFMTLELDIFYKKYSSIFGKIDKTEFEKLSSEINEDITFNKKFKKFLYILLGVISFTTAGHFVKHSATERIAKNAEAFSYGDFETKINQIIQGDEKFAKSNFDSLDLVTKLRVEAFRKYLSLENFSNILKPSKYKPTDSKDDVEYYTYDESPKELMKGLKVLLGTEDEDAIWQGLTDYHTKYDSFPVATVEGLYGNCTIGAKTDEHGKKYISIYDKWDLDVLHFKSLGKELGIDLSGIGIDQLLGNSVEYYDRYYLKNNSSKIKKENSDIVSSLRLSTIESRNKSEDLHTMIKNYGGYMKLIRFTLNQLIAHIKEQMK